MIGWALRCILLCGGAIVLGVTLLHRVAELLPDRAAPSVSARSATAAAPNTIVYRANQRGHFLVDAAVNGAPIRLLVDTGASVVALTPEDARAAGIDPGALVFSARAATANGVVRMAPVTLREVRIDQLSLYDIPAAVFENLNVSLLGMSFLTRLQSYEMRDGKLTIEW